VFSPQGEKDVKGKVYMQAGKMRMELDGAGDKAVTISRPDKKLTWVLMPDEKMYMEQAHQEDPKIREWTPDREARSKLLGEETVSGLPCKKYQGEGKDTFYWISDKIGFPVKTQDPHGSMLLRNIQIGAVPGSLFEVPPGYEKFSIPQMPSMPGGMMPGMPKGK
jgi:hypothetical protein